jgi:CHAT domain-containing protein/tetratricopeptide (TPR) repeat protein
MNAQADNNHSHSGLSVRQQASEKTEAQKPQEVEMLEQGKPIERELAAGETHTYQIGLVEDDYLMVIVEQRGIDVAVRVLGPDGKQISEIDSEIRKQGEERVSQVAEVAGSYRLSVQSAQRAAPAGRYEIMVAELRKATEMDRQLQEARKLSAESIRLHRAGKYDEARSLAERALEIRRKELGPEHLDVAQSLNNLGNIYYDKGDYEKAELLYQQSLALREKRLGPEHHRVAASLNNLALIYYDQGDYEKAEQVHQRVLAILEKTLGAEHPQVANSLNNLAISYRAKGDYAKAESIQQRVLAIREKTLGPEHPLVAQTLHNLANLYDNKGDSVKAERLYQRALAIGENALGREHPQVASSLNSLAIINRNKGDYVKAEQFQQRALGIREKTLGSEHPHVATSLSNLADIYHDKGNYTKAETLYQRALAIQEKSLGPEHPQVAQSLNNLSALYAAKGDIGRAVAFQSRAIGISERNVVYNLRTGSERQKLAYLASLSAAASQTISLHVRYAPDDLAAASLAATTILWRKGRTLDAMSASFAALRQRFNPQDQALLHRLNDVTAQLARLVLGGPKRITPAEHRKEIKALEEEKETLEAEISRHSAEYRAQSRPITLAAVQAAIPTNAVLIEFASYQPFNAKAVGKEKEYGAPHYVVYLLRREGEIKWQELGEAKAIDDAIDGFRRALSDPKRQDLKRLARAVEEKVMQPLRALVGGATQILVSPDGALNLIPFEALVDEQGGYLIGRYAFTYLTSGRDLLRLQVERKSRSAPLVVADPRFGERDQLARADIPPRKLAGMRLWQSVTTDTDLSSAYFAPLLGTALEAKEIKSLFPEARVLVGEEATEASLKQAVAPGILHIATHGFFLEDRTVRLEGRRGLSLMRGDGDGGGVSEKVKIENPLLRSGLALAGANLRTGRNDDGILTALEASGLNLWGTKLVVLSACDTGVGVVRTGEGVYGLRRAFVLAGSETQVMSLWQVGDYVTQRLMKAYYIGLKQGQGRGEALRRLKLEMMRQKGMEHPYYWASFIQSGKWTELEDKR